MGVRLRSNLTNLSRSNTARLFPSPLRFGVLIWHTAPMSTTTPPLPVQGSQQDNPAAAQDHPRTVMLMLNFGHALDHLFLLIFATAVGAIALDFGLERWEDLMPYGVGAFFLFGLGSMPSGRLGDLWGRRQMLLVFFFGLAIAAFLTAMAQNPWQLAAG